MDLAASGRLRSIVEEVVPLAEVNAGLSRLRGGEVTGRLVVAP